MIEFNTEIRNRIRLSVAAYAYEILNESKQEMKSLTNFSELNLSRFLEFGYTNTLTLQG